MPRLSKCKDCGIELTKEQKHIYSNKTYCEKCYTIKIYERESYNKLISSICQYFNIQVPTGLILKQIKDFKEQFQYTYDGMIYCLWYITQIKNINLEIKYGITMIKYEYENSKEYFFQQESIKNSIVKPADNTIVKTIQVTKRKPCKNLLLDLDKI